VFRKEKTIWLNIIHIKVNLQNDADMCEQMNRFSPSFQDNKLKQRTKQNKTKQRLKKKENRTKSHTKNKTVKKHNLNRFHLSAYEMNAHLKSSKKEFKLRLHFQMEILVETHT
jgi:uncharacterized FlaG/YvyC family protein